MAANAERVRKPSWIESRVLHAAVAIGLALAVFAVCVTGWWYSTYLVPIQDVKEAVRAKLDGKEPARFEHVWYSKQTRVGCGYVAVKDAGGKYGENRHFILLADGNAQFEPPREAKGDAAQQIAALEEQARYAQAIRSNCLR
ncbi:hypothetical protein [Variovorax sp. KK3]|uniref:hypothetical protein n=1 Tax=Variovorax sp. KK3 TaxID=1855728 RepID=UPI00097C3ACB|nr:hypothetical protein [Variovorax sp. KK3]